MLIRFVIKAVRKYSPKCILNKIPDVPYLKMVYYAYVGKKLNLDVPKTFNDKLQWLKLHDRKSEYTMMVDKLEVKSRMIN